MRFVSVRDLRGKSAEVLRNLSEEREVVITSNGRPVAILAAVDESSLEESLSAFRQVRAVDTVARLQSASMRTGTDSLTAEDIEGEIEAVRKTRVR